MSMPEILNNIETTHTTNTVGEREFSIPIYTAIPPTVIEEDKEPIIFIPGVGETGRKNHKIIATLASLLSRRVVSYEPRLPSQSTNPWIDSATIAQQTHQRVKEKLAIDKYSVIGHSMSGFNIGAIIQQDASSLTAITEISPIGIIPEATASREWLEFMHSTPYSQRGKYVKEKEEHWLKNTLNLAVRYTVLNGTQEIIASLRERSGDPQFLIRFFKDLGPGLKNSIAAFGVSANISHVKELEELEKSGSCPVNIVTGKDDSLLPLKYIKKALEKTVLEKKLHVVEQGRGRRHTSLTNSGGVQQLKVATTVHGR